MTFRLVCGILKKTLREVPTLAKDPNSLDSLFSSADDLDLAMIEFGLGLDGPEENSEEDEEPRLNPLHDPDSLDFFLWLEEEVDKEVARRQAEKAGKPRWNKQRYAGKPVQLTLFPERRKEPPAEYKKRWSKTLKPKKEAAT